MNISIFHFLIKRTNPAGSCVKLIVEALCRDHLTDVYAIEFENPCPDERVTFRKIISPTRPLVLMFVIYYVCASIRYFFIRKRKESDVVIFTEARLPFGDIAYPHFCHRAYLQRFWQQNRVTGFRRLLKWLNHYLHLMSERFIYQRVKLIVVPSNGLKRELMEVYEIEEEKIRVIQNPVDLKFFEKPDSFDRQSFMESQNIVFAGGLTGVFVALGDFERKGLDLLLDSMVEMNDGFNLVVVGGNESLVAQYEEKVRSLKLTKRVMFVGMQNDIRPFLWSSDVFVFPSMYEVFPLVTLQAAASELPLLVTDLYGVEEFMKFGVTGYLINRDKIEIGTVIQKFAALTAHERIEMGKAAKLAVEQYSVERFKARWLELVDDFVKKN